MKADRETEGQSLSPASGLLMPLRHVVATNLFKGLLLGERHKPGDPQSHLVGEYFGFHSEDLALDTRTWTRWFQPEIWSPQQKKYEVLDRVLATVSRTTARETITVPAMHPRFISTLAFGGLMRDLRRPTMAGKPVHALVARAADYEPVSPLHLHIDAIEAAALATDVGGVQWDTAKSIAAKRILEIVHQRWNRRSGRIYAELAKRGGVAAPVSDTGAMAPERRSRIEPAYLAGVGARNATPDWGITNIQPSESSIHAHRLLFALAADTEFLVDDRFNEWFLDLATASIAMFALAWSERKATFGPPRTSDELIYWLACDHAFFQDTPEASQVRSDSQEDKSLGVPNPAGAFARPGQAYAESLDPSELAAHREIAAALQLTGADWHLSSVDVVLRAGSVYRSLVQDLGASSKSIRTSVLSCIENHQMTYLG